MLTGIVAMQVEVLKLGARMGHSIERASFLQGRNESLRASVASLADDQRIERLAAKRGMLMPQPTDLAFLSASDGAGVTRALAGIHAPSPARFLAASGPGGVVSVNSSSANPSSANSTSASSSSSDPSSAGSTPASASTPSGGSTAATGTSGTSAPAATGTSGASPAALAASGAGIHTGSGGAPAP